MRTFINIMKFRLFILPIVLMCALTACALLENPESEALDMEDEMFSRFSDTDSERADAILNDIVSSIQSKDSTLLYDIFSVHTVESSDDLDAQIQLLFDFYNGDMVSYQRFGPSSHSLKEGNAYIKEIAASYDIITTTDTYRIAFKFCTIDSANPNNVGLLSIYIINASNSDMDFAYWGDGVWTPGITIETDVSGK